MQRPILILGAPRSGTSFLTDILQAHPSLHALIEPRFTWRYGNDGKSDMLKPNDARPEVIQHIRARFAAAVRQAGAERLVEKTPSNALRLEFVLRVLPDARVVHMIRNGYDSVRSIHKFWTAPQGVTRGVRAGLSRQRLRELGLRRLPRYSKEIARRLLGRLWRTSTPRPWGPRLPGMEGMLRELELIEVCALQWRTCVEMAAQIGRQLPEEQYREFRLEAFSDQRFREMLDFLELDPHEAVLHEFEQRFDPAKASAASHQPTDSQAALIRRWIEPCAEWLGAARQE